MLTAHFGLQNWELNFMQKHLSNDTNVYFNFDNIEGGLYDMEKWDSVSIFIHTQITSEILDKLPNLKFISTRSTGFDHIDISACNKRGIKVSNVPGYGSHTVAEHTFALLLSVSKRITTLSARSKHLDFSFKDQLGFDLSGKTLGVIGAGKIGKNVITIAKGFGMNVVAFDPFQDLNSAKELGFEYLEIEKLLSTSEIISLHTPLNQFTENLLNRKNLDLLQSNTVFINTSRGGLIKNNDLLYVLDKGLISFALLDTMDGEENMFKGNVDNHQKDLLARDNVVYTPHSAFYTREALERILQTTISNLESYGSGTVENLVS